MKLALMFAVSAAILFSATLADSASAQGWRGRDAPNVGYTGQGWAMKRLPAAGSGVQSPTAPVARKVKVRAKRR